MSTNESDHSHEVEVRPPRSHMVVVGLLTVGLVAALAGDAYLWVRSTHLNEQIAQNQADAQTQISALKEATTTLLQQEQQRLEEVAHQVKGVNDSATTAIRRARTEAQRQDADLSQKLAEQQQQVSSEITQLKDTTTSKFSEVSTNVDGVKANVETVKSNVASTQSELDKTRADLKRVMGDMGVMSGLIATNSKDLGALRALGERNYFEFDLNKSQSTKRVGDITLTLKKSDPKHNRYSVDVLADDKHLEKRDRTINEPVQLYMSGNSQPYEIVVNQVNKDQIVGYLATPKVKLARR